MADIFTVFYPLKPSTVAQAFGADPEYYARFHDGFGKPELGHMGIDFIATHGTPCYASHDGLASFERDSHGGEGIYIRTTKPFAYKDSQAYFRTIYWHLVGDTDARYVSPIPMDGKEYPVKAGDLIGYTDNTGAPYESSGPHLHFGLVPTNVYGNPLEPANGFGGCIDATPFFNRFYAVDAQTVITKLQMMIPLLKQLVDLYQTGVITK